MVDRHLDSGFGRDGISGMLSADRVLRARDLAAGGSQPRVRTEPPPAPGTEDEWVLAGLVARASGRRRTAPPPGL